MNSYKKCIGDCKKTKPITDFGNINYTKKDIANIFYSGPKGKKETSSLIR